MITSILTVVVVVGVAAAAITSSTILVHHRRRRLGVRCLFIHIFSVPVRILLYYRAFYTCRYT